MKTKVKDNEIRLYGILCGMIVVITSFPIACHYIMAGGRVTEWIARVNEMAAGLHNGEIYFFPRMETLAETGDWENIVNSNFWLFLPGILVRMTGNVVFAYRIYMLLIQSGTLLASLLFFREIFLETESRLPVFFGTLLYMTCPYRIFICYDLADLVQAAAWMLLPLYTWAAFRAFAEKGTWKQIILAGVILAGAGYANIVFFITFFGLTLSLSIFTKKFKGLLCLIAGGILGFPGLYRLTIYIFGKGFPELDDILQSIMQKGYRPGQFFSSYYWRDNHPGMGLGMLICLLVVLWMRFVKGEKRGDKKSRLFSGMSVFLIVLSMAYFPWDFVQRMGNWSLRLVSLIDTPAVFWGMAYFGLCVPAAEGMYRLEKSDNKILSFAVPLIVLLACVWVCIYQCNMLTYTRPPVILG